MSLIRTDWNVVAELEQGHFATGKWHLDWLGAVPGETGRSDLLVATVPDVGRWLDELLDRWRVGWSVFDDFRYIRPVDAKLEFDTDSEFIDRAGGLALELAPRLSGCFCSIHVESRGYHEDETIERVETEIRSALEDQLGETYWSQTDGAGDDHVLIDLEIVDGTAGIAAWTSEEREKYPFLGLGVDPAQRPSRPGRSMRV